MFQIGGVIKRINRHSCCTIPASIIWGDKRQTLGIIPRRERNPYTEDCQWNSNQLQLTKITLNDPRWPSSEGWVKMQQIVPTSQGNINIHYVYNQTLKMFDDFKFKP